MSRRKNIPKEVRRQIFIEAGYRCPVPRCTHETGLDIHHIDGDRSNINPENLLLLCAVHHRMATEGKMDKKACMEMKKRLSREYWMSSEPDMGFISLPTRKEYIDAVINAIESAPKVLRAIVVGPHFLHPMWVMQRRLEREQRKSFSLTLRNYLEESLKKGDRDIRLIVRNSKRYPEIVRKDLKRHEVDNLIKEMKFALHHLFSPHKTGSTISFCCMETGLFQYVIADESCFETIRNSELSRIEKGHIIANFSFVDIRKEEFEGIFDENFKGLQSEIEVLENYIDSLKYSFCDL